MLLSSRCDGPGLLCLCPSGVSDRGVIAACHPHYQVYFVTNKHTRTPEKYCWVVYPFFFPFPFLLSGAVCFLYVFGDLLYFST